ncbi:hypothetical protein Tco_0184022 [Tanacetum coccineum]
MEDKLSKDAEAPGLRDSSNQSRFAKETNKALAICKTEAEYVSARKACQQALWMKQALIDYDICLDYVPIMCDNKGAIDISKNPVQHSRTKHTEIRHHFLRDNVQKGNISIEKVASKDYIADIFTKPLKLEISDLANKLNADDEEPEKKLIKMIALKDMNLRVIGENDGDIMFVELIKKYDDSSEEELEEDENVVTGEELGVEYFDKFPTRSELAYHKYLMCAPISSLFLRNPSL